MISVRICKYCGKEFSIEITRGSRQAYCSPLCRTRYNVDQRKTFVKAEPEYLKGDKNVLDLLIKELAKQDISYSDWKKQLSLSKVSKIDLTI